MFLSFEGAPFNSLDVEAVVRRCDFLRKTLFKSFASGLGLVRECYGANRLRLVANAVVAQPPMLPTRSPATFAEFSADGSLLYAFSSSTAWARLTAHPSNPSAVNPTFTTASGSMRAVMHPKAVENVLLGSIFFNDSMRIEVIAVEPIAMAQPTTFAYFTA
jgi:hypothetical protein